MGKIIAPLPVKLFCGILTSLPEMLRAAQERLEARFGPVDACSEILPFDQTSYYDQEMGCPIQRQFLAFRDLIAPAGLPSVKRAANDLEAALAAECSLVRRPVNIDPGYLEEAKIVLASTKNFYHRILLSADIYGEVTLRWAGGGWQAFPWTFPDFRSGRYDAFFTSLRRTYREQLRPSGGE